MVAVTHRLLKQGKRILRMLDKRIERHSLVPTSPFIDPSVFEWPVLLERNWATIRTEAESLMRTATDVPRMDSISPQQQRLSQSGGWGALFLYAYGAKSVPNCRRCPVTFALIESIPGLNLAAFSVLAAGARIPPHEGPYRGFVRYHLGLVVPKSTNCYLRVGEECRFWGQGASLMFDDTFQHEACNESVEPRVILMIDVTRPMRGYVRWVDRVIVGAIGISPYVRNAKANQLAWDLRQGN